MGHPPEPATVFRGGLKKTTSWAQVKCIPGQESVGSPCLGSLQMFKQCSHQVSPTKKNELVLALGCRKSSPVLSGTASCTLQHETRRAMLTSSEALEQTVFQQL
uniref:Uncharacterized protein n=1 Tax=Sphaerodactylus townsendi TaxID=933632 RepID=A0ACB8FRG0_9SAUR